MLGARPSAEEGVLAKREAPYSTASMSAPSAHPFPRSPIPLIGYVSVNYRVEVEGQGRTAPWRSAGPVP